MTAPQAGACPRCRTGFDGEQEYCLECGLRLPHDRTALTRMSLRAARRWGWLPGEWVWPAMLAFLVAVGGAAAAIALGQADDGTGAAVSTAIGGNVRVRETLPTAPEPTTSARTAPRPTPPPPAAASRNTLTVWPLDEDGWTIVIQSLPQDRGAEAAREKAREALGKGLPRVGVVDSGRFSSLQPGYFVVFTGIYDSAEEAASALQRAKAAYPLAYTREVAG